MKACSGMTCDGGCDSGLCMAKVGYAKPFSLPELERLAREKERTCQYCTHWVYYHRGFGKCRISGADGPAKSEEAKHIMTGPTFGCNQWMGK